MSPLVQLILFIFLAFILDLILGDPRYRLHPIRLMGGCIARLQHLLKRMGLYTRTGGVLLVGIVVGGSLMAYGAVTAVLCHIHGLLGLGFDLYMAYSCLALKDLFTHIKQVMGPLESGNVSQAKTAIARIVGRDVRLLDEPGISRAAIETLAENFVDGFISPLFWYLIGGLLAYALEGPPVTMAVGSMLVFKGISTLDSMVGYRTIEYERFGWAGARCDDLMNFLPARLSLLVLFIGSWICGGYAATGLRTALRDRLKHDSPNAAHAESFMAGALNVRLGGPTRYPDGIKPKPWLGAEYPDPLPAHIRKAGTILKCSAWATMVISSLILLFPATP
ncbi:MAG: adenosylcobinamide-phosphate synthase CbiB [Desulfobacteraceae bacterium]